MSKDSRLGSTSSPQVARMTCVVCHCDSRLERHSGFESFSDRVHVVLMDPIASLQDDISKDSRLGSTCSPQVARMTCGTCYSGFRFRENDVCNLSCST